MVKTGKKPTKTAKRLFLRVIGKSKKQSYPNSYLYNVLEDAFSLDSYPVRTLCYEGSRDLHLPVKPGVYEVQFIPVPKAKVVKNG